MKKIVMMIIFLLICSTSAYTFPNKIKITDWYRKGPTLNWGGTLNVIFKLYYVSGSTYTEMYSENIPNLAVTRGNFVAYVGGGSGWNLIDWINNVIAWDIVKADTGTTILDDKMQFLPTAYALNAQTALNFHPSGNIKTEIDNKLDKSGGTVTGALSVGAGLIVTGGVTLNNGLTVNNGAIVNNNLTVNGSISVGADNSLTSGGESTLHHHSSIGKKSLYSSGYLPQQSTNTAYITITSTVFVKFHFETHFLSSANGGTLQFSINEPSTSNYKDLISYTIAYIGSEYNFYDYYTILSPGNYKIRVYDNSANTQNLVSIESWGETR